MPQEFRQAFGVIFHQLSTFEQLFGGSHLDAVPRRPLLVFDGHALCGLDQVYLRAFEVQLTGQLQPGWPQNGVVPAWSHQWLVATPDVEHLPNKQLPPRPLWLAWIGGRLPADLSVVWRWYLRRFHGRARLPLLQADARLDHRPPQPRGRC
jgi:hypothetical protein